MDDTPSKRTCVICANEIPNLAQKCIHCGSYQNWRRHIDIGNTTSALLIALFTVATTFIGQIHSLYQTVFVNTLEPKFIANIIDISTESATVLYNNLGSSRIYIQSGLLCRVPVVKDGVDLYDSPRIARFPTPSEVEELHIVHFALEKEDGYFLEGGQSVTLTYPINEHRPESKQPFPENMKVVKGYCFISIIGLDGKLSGSFSLLEAIQIKFLQSKLREVRYYRRPDAVQH